MKSVYKYQLWSHTLVTGSEREIKKIFPFTITFKRIKYMGKNLTRGERPVHWKL